MARRFLTALVLALLPLVAVISHPELRLVLQEDVTFLWRGDVDITYPSFGSAERRALLEAQHIQGEDAPLKRLQSLSQLARRTGKLYLYAEALRYACVAPLRPQQEPQGVRADPRHQQMVRKMAQEALSLSEEMIRKDPQNAFPYLVKTGALFALQKPNEAVDTFLQAARCPRYEEYLGEMLAVLAPRWLPADVRHLQSARVILPHLGSFRGSAQYLRQLADEAEKRGEHARSVELGWAVVAVGGKIRDAGEATIQSLVGVAIQRIGWTRHRQRRGADPLETIQRLSDDFARYAAQHGEEDVARLVRQEAQKSIQFQRVQMDELWNPQGSEARLYGTLEKVLSMRGAGITLLMWVFSMALCFGAAFVAQRLWFRQAESCDSLAGWTAALVAGGAFVGVAVAGLLRLSPYGNLFQLIAQSPSVSSEWLPQPFVAESFSFLHALTAATLALLASVCFAPPMIRLARQHGQSLMAWGVLFGLVLALLPATSEEVLPFGFPNIAAREVVLSILVISVVLLGATGLLAWPLYAFRLHKPLPAPLRVGIASLWGIASFYMWQGYLVETALWLLVGVLLWASWGRGLPGAAQMEVHHALYRFGMSALILAVLGLWLYAMLGYASLPARAAQHAYIDQIITQGEVSLLEAK